AALSVDRLAHWWTALRDAAPRTVLLLGRSHGQEALAALGAQALSDLRGKRMATYSQSSSYYFALWAMSRAGLAAGGVKLVELGSTLDAGNALREGKADAAAGVGGDPERGGPPPRRRGAPPP